MYLRYRSSTYGVNDLKIYAFNPDRIFANCQHGRGCGPYGVAQRVESSPLRKRFQRRKRKSGPCAKIALMKRLGWRHWVTRGRQLRCRFHGPLQRAADEWPANVLPRNHFLGDYPNIKWRRLKELIPQDLKGRTVLEIGCNAGFYALEMKRRGADLVVAIDSDPRYLAQARLAAEVRQLQMNSNRCPYMT
jgi:2-polyprenyl-3-methyl-5-hydroxy-6-metoxy-1,4-benzoquinol methylase